PCYKDFGSVQYSLVGEENLALTFEDGTNAGVESDWYYNVGICSNIIPDAQYKCARSYGAGGEVDTGPAPAFQINKKSRDCHRLAEDIFDEDTVSWDLLNPNDPAMGFSLTYSGGDTCEGYDGNSTEHEVLRRSIRLDFICDTSEGGFSQNATVIESETCQYNLVIKGRQGCPLNCPVVKAGFGEQRLCNEHGVCDFNAKTGQAGCFCNKGWQGGDCTINSDPGRQPVPNYAGAIVGTLIAGCLVGVLLSLGGYYLYNHYHKAPGATGASFGGDDSYAQLGEEGGASAPTFTSTSASTAETLDSGAGGYAPPQDDDGPLVG
ncbi:unnamed protein product, partial [Symbiodinium sp. KB8]